MEYENGLLRQIARMEAKQDKLSDELLAKDKIIASLVAVLTREGLDLPPGVKKLQEAVGRDNPFTDRNGDL